LLNGFWIFWKNLKLYNQHMGYPLTRHYSICANKKKADQTQKKLIKQAVRDITRDYDNFGDEKKDTLIWMDPRGRHRPHAGQD
jgi:aromatic ring hydroxylase